MFVKVFERFRSSHKEATEKRGFHGCFAIGIDEILSQCSL